MSRLEELIQQYCPDGVEWKKLKDVADFQYGYPFAAELFTDDDSFCPLIRIRDVKPGTTKTFYKGEVLPEYLIHKGDILVGMDGEFNLAKWQSADALLNQRVCKISANKQNEVIDGFLYHYLLPLFKQIEASIQGSTVKHLSAQKLNTITIPVPPLPVQEEIVRILDNFTELQAELQAELQKRLQQYEYYRDKLLSFSDLSNWGGQEVSVEWKKLGEIGRIFSGKNKQKKKEGAYPVYGSTGIIAYCDEFKYDKTLILVARVGANAGYTHIASGQYDVSDNTLIIDLDKKNVINKYIFYILVNINLNRYAKGGGQPLITAGEIKEITIPVPPLSEQQRIVDILDRFSTLTTDITAGLPAEIEARRKQYEYYRDQLLTFKQKA